MPAESRDRFGPGDEAPPVTRGTQLDWRRVCSVNGSCVEIANLPEGGVAIRDGKAAEMSDVLSFSRDEWDAFVAGVKAGEFG